MPYTLLADLVLSLHFLLVGFVIGGFLLVLLGNACKWAWVNGYAFRMAHLACIVFVVAETWCDITCPLTTLEVWLRAQAQVTTYDGSCIEYWLQRWLFYTAPSWVFTLVYSLFGLSVIATWWIFPPQRKRRTAPQAHHDSHDA